MTKDGRTERPEGEKNPKSLYGEPVGSGGATTDDDKPKKSRGKARWSAEKKAGRGRGGSRGRSGRSGGGGGTRGGAKTGAISKAERRLNRPAGRQGAGPGVPKAVERGSGGRVAIQTPARLSVDDNARLTWMLDLLAWAGHGEVAGRIDLRGTSAALPPVVLPEVGDTWLVALEPVDAIRRLRSRHRAFSQMAGRYSALLIAARDAGRKLRVEMWDLDASGAIRPHDSALDKLWPQLGSYLGGEVILADAALLADRLAKAKAGGLPAELVGRNPVAWGVNLAAGPCEAEG